MVLILPIKIVFLLLLVSYNYKQLSKSSASLVSAKLNPIILSPLKKYKKLSFCLIRHYLKLLFASISNRTKCSLRSNIFKNLLFCSLQKIKHNAPNIFEYVNLNSSFYFVNNFITPALRIV